MAAYTCNLDKNEQIYIENQEQQTVIKLTSSGQSQEQSQSNSFETGKWRVPPTVFQTRNGVVLRIEAEHGQHFIQLQANRMTRLDSDPWLSDADVLPLRQDATEAASSHSMQPMQPMEPMKPMELMKPMSQMQIDDMQMQIKPMMMQMGNMEMRMGEPLQTNITPKQRQSVKNFCSQCGSKVGQSDRFCSNCGNALAQ